MNPTYRLEPVMAVPQVPQPHSIIPAGPPINAIKALPPETTPVVAGEKDPKPQQQAELIISMNKQNVTPENAVIPFQPDEFEDSEVPDFDYLQRLAEMENENQIVAMSQTKTTTTKESTKSVSKQMMKRPTHNIPMMFSNCHIAGNIAINLNK